MKCKWPGCLAEVKRKPGNCSRYCLAHKGGIRASRAFARDMNLAAGLCACGNKLYTLKCGKLAKRCKACAAVNASQTRERVCEKGPSLCRYGNCEKPPIVPEWGRRAVYCAEHAAKMRSLFLALRQRKREAKSKELGPIRDSPGTHPACDLDKI